MNYAEWIDSIKQNQTFIRPGDDSKRDYKEHDGICVLKEFVPIRVDAISSAILPQSNTEMDKIPDIEIRDESGVAIGILVACGGLETSNVFEITDARYAAYINDVDKSLFGTPRYRFKYHYAVIDLPHYDNYIADYATSSFIWGGYFHDVSNILLNAHKSIPSFLTAISGLKMPEQAHILKGARAIAQPYTFERFLNQYHLLEMLFTYQLVENIQSAVDVISGIDVIKRYLAVNFKNERSMLKEVLVSRCKRLQDLEKHFLRIRTDPYYMDRAEVIFGKSSNSGKEGQMQGFLKHVNKKIPPNYFNEEKLCNLAVESIYEVRCAIAHNKLGEYFLTEIDERFVVEIIEPLMQEILLQAFSA